MFGLIARFTNECCAALNLAWVNADNSDGILLTSHQVTLVRLQPVGTAHERAFRTVANGSRAVHLRDKESFISGLVADMVTVVATLTLYTSHHILSPDSHSFFL
jgi:hypothetical protein